MTPFVEIIFVLIFFQRYLSLIAIKSFIICHSFHEDVLINLVLIVDCVCYKKFPLALQITNVYG
jgi:hypothetical protein